MSKAPLRSFRPQLEALEERWVPSATKLTPAAPPPAIASSSQGGGNVLPPKGSPHGTSIADAVNAIAVFSASGNNPAFYPQTAYQVLYVDPSTLSFNFDSNGTLQETGGSSFTVKPGTQFFVPLAFVDDGPPILGSFPTDSSTAATYFFAHDQLGTANLTIGVDGKTKPVGSPYLAGPIATAPLADGGSHIIMAGVFLTPMTPGTHTVEITGDFAGDLLVGFTGFPIHFDYTYTVTVSPH